MDTQNSGSNVKVFAVIPARYAPPRLPGKPLASIEGRPMVQHVVERVRQAARVARVVVATDDERVKKAVEGFGGNGARPRRDHRSGTDRVAEIAAHLEADIYVDIQGDEPLIDPGTIDAVVAEMLDDDSIQIATPCTAITQGNDVMDPNIVKVVRDFDGNCLYFSRAPIPWVRDTKAAAAPHHWKHVGLYAFRREALLEFPTLPPGELEAVEQLEELRGLQNGFRVCP